MQHILQRDDSAVLSILYLIKLVRIDCSWELHIKALVHPFKSLFLIHLHVLFLSLPSISLANYLSMLYAIHSFFLCSSLVFLNSLGSTVSSCVIVQLVLTTTSSSSIMLLLYHPRPFSPLFTLFSHPISPLPPFFRKTYNCTTSLLGCNSLFIVIDFLVFLSISCSSFLFHLSISAPYLKMETAQVFSAHILFLPFSLFFKINFALLKCSFLNISFISCSFTLSYSNIPRYSYPSSSISLIFSPFGNSILSVDLTYPLFIIIIPHFIIIIAILFHNKTRF